MHFSGQAAVCPLQKGLHELDSAAGCPEPQSSQNLQSFHQHFCIQKAECRLQKGLRKLSSEGAAGAAGAGGVHDLTVMVVWAREGSVSSHSSSQMGDRRHQRLVQKE